MSRVPVTTVLLLLAVLAGHETTATNWKPRLDDIGNVVVVLLMWP